MNICSPGSPFLHFRDAVQGYILMPRLPHLNGHGSLSPKEEYSMLAISSCFIYWVYWHSIILTFIFDNTKHSIIVDLKTFLSFYTLLVYFDIDNRFRF